LDHRALPVPLDPKVLLVQLEIPALPVNEDPSVPPVPPALEVFREFKDQLARPDRRA